MPGITHAAYQTDSDRLSNDRKRRSARKPSVVYNSNHHHHHQQSSFDSVDSPPPYPFKTSTTAYGLNEPQWSVGPPPLRFDRSPYARVSLPQLYSSPIVLHEILQYQDQKHMSSICWPVHQPPASAARLSSSYAYASTAYHWKALPALSSSSSSSHHHHPHSSLTIRVASTPFTRPIIVFPSNLSTGIITIGDVLNSIYRGLRQCANDELCEAMEISPSLLSEQLFRKHGFPATTPASQSCTGESGDEVSSHIVQILNFKTMGVGLAPSETERDVYILYTEALCSR